MATEYAKVLVAQKKTLLLWGDQKQVPKDLQILPLKCRCSSRKILNESESTFSHAIVATNVRAYMRIPYYY